MRVHGITKNTALLTGLLQRLVPFSLLFLLIEFYDELSYGIDGAALPVIRGEVGLTYAQVGLMLGLPGIVSTLVEPVIMLLGDTRLRKGLIVGGGMAMALSVALVAGARSFPLLVLAFALAYPASGAFVTLSQATLMDLNPGREPHMMARWTVAGSLGNLLGPLLLAGGFALGLGWRWAFAALAILGVALALFAMAKPFPRQLASNHHSPSLRKMLADLVEAARNRDLLRWLGLLEMSDLLLDVFTGYLALYLTDVAGATPAQASLIFGAAMLANLVSDLVLIPLLERMPGRPVVRVSAAVTAGLYIIWLLVPGLIAKTLLLLLIRLSTLGWYQIMQGEAYASAPGKSGTVMAVNSLAGLVGSGVVWGIGLIAHRVGLPAAMWALLLGPLSLALFVPRDKE